MPLLCQQTRVFGIEVAYVLALKASVASLLCKLVLSRLPYVVNHLESDPVHLADEMPLTWSSGLASGCQCAVAGPADLSIACSYSGPSR